MLTTLVKYGILRGLSGISGSGSWSISAGYYMGLSTTTPQPGGYNDTASSNTWNFTEPSAANNYERVYINTATSSGPQYPFDWVDTTTYDSVWNKYEVHFNVDTTADWGTITHVGIFDSSGKLLAYGPLTNPINVEVGHIPTILLHEAIISLDVSEESGD